MPVEDGTVGTIDAPSITDLRIVNTLALGSAANAAYIRPGTNSGTVSVSPMPGDVSNWPYLSLEPNYVGSGGGSGISFKNYVTGDSHEHVGQYEFFTETKPPHIEQGLQLYSTEDAGVMLRFKRDAGGEDKPGIQFGVGIAWPFTPSVSLFKGFDYVVQTNGGFFVSENNLNGVYIDPGFSGTLAYISMDGFIEMEEVPGIQTPGLAPTNMGRLYLRDNGSGKTQAVIQFQSGAPQVISTEP